MNIKTYIFGNPDGWKLHNADQAELSYFKSFYVNNRRGERLMVNRRDDGSIVYVYLMYGISEVEIGADSEHKRGGYGHLGLAMVIDDGYYTPEFTTVFRFMSTLFHKLLEREDSPIVARPENSRMPYSYRIHKFSEAESAMSWLQQMMPRIFEKTGMTSLAGDSSFASGSTGRIAAISDEAGDDEILQAFRRNNWVAVSSEFRRVENAPVAAREEIFLPDIEKFRVSLTQQLLDWSLGNRKMPEKEADNLYNAIGEMRVRLANYLRMASPDDDVKQAKDLSKSFSKLSEQLGQLKTKSSVSSGATTQTAKGNDGSMPASSHNHNGAKTSPESLEKTPRRKDSPLKSIVGAVAILLIIVVVSIALIKNGDGGEGNLPSPDPVPPLVENKVDSVEFAKAVGENDFAEAFSLIQGKDDYDRYFKQLHKATDKYLWDCVDSDSAIKIAQFFADSRSEMLEALGYHSDINNEKEWNARVQVHEELVALTQKKKPTQGDVDNARVLLAKASGLKSRYGDLVNNMKVETPKPIVEEKSSDKKKDAAPSQVTVTCKGTSKVSTNGSPIGFTVKKGETFKLVSTEKIKFDDKGYTVTPSRDRKEFTVTASGNLMTFKSGGTTITITVK